jgi:hypothetical protein
MNRTYQMMSNGQGAAVSGAVTLATAHHAQANSRDYHIQIGLAGPTTARPVQGDPDFPGGVPGGILYLDTTLGYIVVSDGTGLWRNPATGASV